MLRIFCGGRRGDLTIVGPRTRPTFKTATDVAQVVIVRFTAVCGGFCLHARDQLP